ncbi:MAG: hypothetical protein JST26_06570 [Bacteroidetes bacterium]|nr:hypothetical protein [Bacteroidota bacterium]
MSKLRLIGFWLFIAAAVVAGVWGYIHIRNNKKPTSDPVAHLPAGAFCVIQTNSFKELSNKLTRQNLIWKALDSSTVIKSTEAALHYFESLPGFDDNVSPLLEDNAMYDAFYKRGKNIGNLIVFGLKERGDVAMISDYLAKQLKPAKNVTSGVYVAPVSPGQDWYITLHEEIIMISSDVSLLSDAIAIETKQSMAVDSSYNALKVLDNDDFFNIYFTHEQPLFNHELINGESMFNVQTAPNTMNLTGYVKPLASSAWQTLYHEPAGSIDCIDLLPKATVSFSVSIVKNTAQLLKEEADPVSEKQWKQLNDSALYNIEKEFTANLGGQITSVNYSNHNSRLAHMKVYSLIDTSQVHAMLQILGDSVLKHPRMVPMVKVRPVFNRLLGKGEVWCVMDDHLFVFESVTDAMDYLDTYLAGDLLFTNAEFMQFASQNLMQQSNFIYYENPSLMKVYKQKGLIVWEDFRRKQEQISHICLTATNAKNEFVTRINIQYRQAETFDSNGSYLWTLKADTTIQTPVYPFKNHSTGENELVFQDEQQSLYLCTATGSVIWKKRINEPIRSAIYTVDIFRNNKFQIFFNTDNYLHLIDRNGNYVQGYPVRLPAKITGAISLFDYDQNKDYRVFVSCADHKIYNYSMYGIRTEGFVPVRTEDVVSLPVQYIKVAGSDYLVTADEAGKIYVFSRKGDGRVGLTNKVAAHLKSFYVEAGKSIQSTRIIYINNQDNSLCKINFEDKKEIIKLDNDIHDFNASYFAVNEDKQVDLVLYGEGGIYIYDLFGSKLGEGFSSSAVYDQVLCQVEAAGGKQVLAFDRAGNKVDVLLADGKRIRSLSGCSRHVMSYDLFNDNKNYLLLIDNNLVKCTK